MLTDDGFDVFVLPQTWRRKRLQKVSPAQQLQLDVPGHFVQSLWQPGRNLLIVDAVGILQDRVDVVLKKSKLKIKLASSLFPLSFT